MATGNSYVNGTPVGGSGGGGGSGDMLAANNLGDVVSASSSRTNLGLGTAATQDSSAFDAAGAATAAAAASISKSLLTTAGDLIAATGASTPSRIAIGADGTFLMVSSSASGTLSYTILPVLPRVDAATSSSLPAYTVGGAGATLTANANGAFGTINGVAAAVGNRYLLLNGASAVDNGLYTLTTVGDGSTASVLTRHSRLAVGASAAGMFAIIRGGTQAGYVYYCSSAPGSDVVGTNNLTWALEKTQLTTEQDALYAHLAGTESITGAKTFTTAPAVAVDDATTNAITDVATLTHTTSGTATTNIGTGLLFAAENASGAAVNTARVGSILTTATGGSEVSALVLYARTGGALVEYQRIHGSGAVSFGNTTDQGSKGGVTWGSGVTNATHTMNCAANGTSVATITVNSSSGITTYGNSAYSTKIISASTVIFGAASSNWLSYSSTTAIFGAGDSSASPGNYTVRGANATGSNIASAVTTYQSGLGTGTGAIGYVSLQGSIAAASGSTQHTAGESGRAYGQYFHTTAGIARKKRNIADAAATVAADDHIVAYTSLSTARAVTLPTPGTGGATATAPRMYVVKDESGSCSGGNTLTLSVTGGANIDGAATLVLNTAYAKTTVYDNGTQYFTA